MQSNYATWHCFWDKSLSYVRHGGIFQQINGVIGDERARPNGNMAAIVNYFHCCE